MDAHEIEPALTRLLENLRHPGLVSAYVFGSIAAGRSHRESDVDIGLLLSRDLYPTDRTRFDQRLLLTSALAPAFGRRSADVVILNDAPPTLGRHIVTEGRRVFSSDPEIDHAFVRDVQLRAADLEPFLRRMRKIKLEAMEGRDVPRRTTG